MTVEYRQVPAFLFPNPADPDYFLPAIASNKLVIESAVEKRLDTKAQVTWHAAWQTTVRGKLMGVRK